MNKITSLVIEAFLSGNAKKVSNTETNGMSLWLFGNKIAEHREDGLYVSNAGWVSKTTKERLNGLPNVTLLQNKKKWYLNGKEWDGSWIKVNDNPPPSNSEQASKRFDLSTEWIKTDGWRGYERPKYSIVGANDTGMFDDSPCRSDIAEREINDVRQLLKKRRIPNKLKTCSTSNVFCIHHYVIVPPFYYKTARELADEHISNIETRLLYLS